MRTHLTSMVVGLLAISSATLAIAQTPAPADSSPSAASSPQQRNATSSPATEAPAQTNGTDPSAASSPHQRQATGGASGKMMKDCMAKEHAKDATQSKDQIKKTCKEQIKGGSKG